jgi:hypothetical protein
MSLASNSIFPLLGDVFSSQLPGPCRPPSGRERRRRYDGILNMIGTIRG